MIRNVYMAVMEMKTFFQTNNKNMQEKYKREMLSTIHGSNPRPRLNER